MFIFVPATLTVSNVENVKQRLSVCLSHPFVRQQCGYANISAVMINYQCPDAASVRLGLLSDGRYTYYSEFCS